MAEWTCLSCGGKKMQHMGVPNHRAMHRRRQDGPVIMRNATQQFRYDYRPLTAATDDANISA